MWIRSCSAPVTRLIVKVVTTVLSGTKTGLQFVEYNKISRPDADEGNNPEAPCLRPDVSFKLRLDIALIQEFHSPRTST